MIVHDCGYEPTHQHEYPDDWTFGGASGLDPRADSRWRGTTYVYLDARLESVWTTQVPLCDDEAIDDFTKWRKDGAVYLQAKRPDGDVQLLDWQYDPITDLVSPLGA